MDLKRNIESINERIAIAAHRAGKRPDEIKLVAVTKTRPVQIIEAAIDLGVRFIGENRVQEAESKIPGLRSKIDEFHFIGHLQTNKVKKLLSLKPELIHSIDSLKTAEKLNAELEGSDMIQDILIQVNTSGEISKSGIEPNLTGNLIRKISLLPRIRIKGLMTIGMLTEDKAVIRSCFERLRNLAEEIRRAQIENVEMDILSMGMTDDFEIAIVEGSNLVRIGSAIFGSRPY